MFFSFSLECFPSSIIATLERFDLGQRFDMEFEACVPVMINWSISMTYLKRPIDLNPKGSILEQNLFITLGSLECKAGIRPRAIFHVLISQPLRFITNSNELGFSVIGMSAPVSALYDFLGRATKDGALLMDKDVDIFASSLTAAKDSEA